MNEHAEIERKEDRPEKTEDVSAVPAPQPNGNMSGAESTVPPIAGTGEAPAPVGGTMTGAEPSLPPEEGRDQTVALQPASESPVPPREEAAESAPLIAPSPEVEAPRTPLIVPPPIAPSPEVKAPETAVLPDFATTTFRAKLSSCRLPNAKQNQEYRYELSLGDLMGNVASVQVLDVGLEPLDTGLFADLQENSIVLHGAPVEKGPISLWIEYTIGERNCNSKRLRAFLPEFTIFPDPKALWRNLPVDGSAPYQTPNEAKDGRFDINGKNLILASKRGRSHAHDGKFRDDAFAFGWVPEFQWLIVAVSDGAGSAEFSRKGAAVACSTFVDELREKLSSPETNGKIDSLDKHNQELALERLLFSIAHQAAVNIRDVANAHNDPVKKYSATFLGYIAKKFADGWLFVSVGIGDGAIAVLDNDDRVHLLNEPDGGEYVGQTRFLTTPEVWKDDHKRTFSVRVPDFRCVFSMTDGVSDPMFETDNNLKDSRKWVDFWDRLRNSEDNPIHFDRHDEQTQAELLAWLDFWSKGNHDDRTLAVLY